MDAILVLVVATSRLFFAVVWVADLLLLLLLYCGWVYHILIIFMFC
jgi:hypothetical protein